MSGAATEPESTARAAVLWSPALTLEYTAAAPPSQGACNAAIAELVAIADRVVAGSGALRDGEWFTVEGSAQGHTGPLLGVWLSEADLTPMQAPNPMRASVDERSMYALACAQCCREIHAGQAPAEGERSGAWIQLAAQGVAVVLAGIAVAWLVDRVSTLVAADRARHEAIAQASRDYAERLRVQVATGVMPPPSPMETEAADAVRAAADTARAAGIGQHVGEAVDTLTKGTLVLGVLWVGWQMFGKGR